MKKQGVDLIDKKLQLKKDKKKTNNKKIRTKVDIKIKLNQVPNDEIEKKRLKAKYIAIKRSIPNLIWSINNKIFLNFLELVESAFHPK